MKDLSNPAPTARVYLIGAGPGDPELLTLRALRLIRSVDVVVYDRLVSPEIMALVPESVRRIDVGKLPKCHKLPQEAINALLVSLAQEGLRVARLKGGDPLIFGRGSEEAEDLRRAGVAVDYVPGITAAQGCAASTGVPLTHRGLATGVRYVTGHRARDAALDLDWASLACEQTTLVVYMGAANIAEIAFQLMRHGMPHGLPVMAVSAATTPRETRLVSTLGCIATDVARVQPDAPVLFVIGHVVALYDSIALAAALTCEGAGMAAYA
ncbi:uroporphyrinogen-III C-methyltransferase [Rhodobacter ferrooxidans]|uniref:uroporphyrinogen-III C-methyltransferase n=1 Tax=Rhodobacter ferrooxidans TaxID=371731 RepID=C8RWI5_9RHOB|nr:uroporphyrinogen-III C-methyltransferase [Rhodobacter sp. SW2]EEW26928.1 uroporphyrin-III C-methyltransferase [Rhodobacter sp. SW2]